MPQESKYADIDMIRGIAHYSDNPYVQDIAIQLLNAFKAMTGALKAIQDTHGTSNHDDSCGPCKAAAILKRELRDLPTRAA